MRIFVFRSAPWYNFVRCCTELKSRFTPAEWISVAQDDVILPEDLFPKNIWTDIRILKGSRFDRKSLSIIPQATQDDVIIIPLNNESGKGYEEFIGYYSSHKILFFSTVFQLEEPSEWKLFSIKHARLASVLNLAVSVPMALALILSLPIWIFRWKSTTVPRP